MFKIYDCDFGVTIAGQKYVFNHVSSLTIDDPEKNNITRGANAGNKVGIAFREGIKEPKVWTIPILDMDAALKDVLDDAFKLQTRVDVFCIDRKSGSGKYAKSAILKNAPQQLNLDETPESMQVSLEFATFDSAETIKDIPA